MEENKKKKCPACGNIINDPTLVRCPRCTKILVKLTCEGSCSKCKEKSGCCET